MNNTISPLTYTPSFENLIGQTIEVRGTKKELCSLNDVISKIHGETYLFSTDSNVPHGIHEISHHIKAWWYDMLRNKKTPISHFRLGRSTRYQI